MRYSQLLASACSWAFGAAEFIRVHSAFSYRNARYGCLEGPFFLTELTPNRRSRKKVLPGARAKKDAEYLTQNAKRGTREVNQIGKIL